YPLGVYNDVGLLNPGTPATFAASFGVWFKTASPGGILMQADNITCTFPILGVCAGSGPIHPGDIPENSWSSFIYIDDNGRLNADGLVSPNAYTDNNWHYAVWTFSASGENALYVDGQNIASGHGSAGGYSSNYAYFVGAAYTVQ